MAEHNVGRGYVEIGVKLDKLKSDMEEAKKVTANAVSVMSKKATLHLGSRGGSGGMTVRTPTQDILNLESERAAIQMRAAQHLERFRLQEEMKDLRKIERDKVNAPKIVEAKARKEEELRVRAEAHNFRVEERKAGLVEKREAKAEAASKKQQEDELRREAKAEAASKKRQEDELRRVAEGQEKQTEALQGALSGFGWGLLKGATGVGLPALTGGVTAGKLIFDTFPEAKDLNEAFFNLSVVAGRTKQSFLPLRDKVVSTGVELSGITEMSAKTAVTLGAHAAMLKGYGYEADTIMRTAAGLANLGMPGGTRDPSVVMAMLEKVPFGGDLSAVGIPTAEGTAPGTRMEIAMESGRIGLQLAELRAGSLERRLERGRAIWQSVKGAGGREAMGDIYGAGPFQRPGFFERLKTRNVLSPRPSENSYDSLDFATFGVAGQSRGPAVSGTLSPADIPTQGKTQTSINENYVEEGKRWLKHQETVDANTEAVRRLTETLESNK